jgi:branched-subunit amino acid aminotransferase/4-amino-4-deoxychorismate lyase
VSKSVAKSHADPTKWSTGLGSLRLQKPDWVFFDGEVRPWEEAVLHVSTEAVVRGLNVFEGLKGYWQPDGRFGFVHLARHYVRLSRSASLLYIPVAFSYDEFESACFDLTRALYRPDKDLYIRATLFVVEGHYGANTRADLVLTGYQQEKEPPSPIAMGVSTWRRAPDVAMPPRIKTGVNYQVARLARIEGASRGYEDMILLNESGRVAESTGACVLVVRGGNEVGLTGTLVESRPSVRSTTGRCPRKSRSCRAPRRSDQDRDLRGVAAGRRCLDQRGLLRGRARGPRLHRRRLHRLGAGPPRTARTGERALRLQASRLLAIPRHAARQVCSRGSVALRESSLEGVVDGCAPSR